MMIRRRAGRAGSSLVLVAAVALGVPLVASAGGAGALDPLEVRMLNSQFSPKEVTVNLTTTVLWANLDLVPHDVTFEAGFGSGAPGGLAPGANWSYSFNGTGSFRYRCVVHSVNFDGGMVGTVRVVDPNAPPPLPKGVPGPGLADALLALVAVAAFARGPRRPGRADQGPILTIQARQRL